MTEQEWAANLDFDSMLSWISDGSNRRKLRLFICAWGYEVWHKVSDQRIWDSLLVAEAFADGAADRRALWAAQASANAARDDMASRLSGRVDRGQRRATWNAHRVADIACAATNDALGPHSLLELTEGETGRTRSALADRLRCIFGNPFRPIDCDPHWRSADTVALARGIYDERAFDRLPLLADALMDAGCDHEQVIGHCQGDGPHVRGCWVVDLVLGKE